jgi:hypothetical protein
MGEGGGARRAWGWGYMEESKEPRNGVIGGSTPALTLRGWLGEGGYCAGYLWTALTGSLREVQPRWILQQSCLPLNNPLPQSDMHLKPSQ